ncbi:MFS transporter [Sediminibacterium soli]|uniref:MFS transporter n=1 Tax=Sediminibacterium soli TaxID=2698829 RepID=UPI00137B874E|nr:MFS transporter [Sediminibacterium soli]NCI47232.1 MFS transporter [Sediminibacterium soli]
MNSAVKQPGVFSIPVIVGALGFFVDVYDLLLFAIIRKPSLASLGLSPDEVLSKGELIISVQMIGLLAGGIIWGILGDKKGRLSVLFGSIILYSLANIANGMVQNVTQYTWLRLIAGIGLAGELGASITLVSEMLPKEKRGLAASVIACAGVCGSVAAYFVYQGFGDWRLCYYIGGVMGFLLLFLRANVMESGLYQQVKKEGVPRGNFLMLFARRERAWRYAKGVLIGLPVWYVIGLLITFSDKFGLEMGIQGIDPGKAVMYQYVALAFGDVSAGLLSNYLRSRRKAWFSFFFIMCVFVVLYFLQGTGWGTAQTMYLICAGLGFGAGTSVLYITMSAEQFGTNLRASTAISIPNVVRGMLPLIILLHKGMRNLSGSYITGGWLTGILVLSLALYAAFHINETFAKDMDFVEA